MKIFRRNNISAWLLLTVFLSMTAVASLHTHSGMTGGIAFSDAYNSHSHNDDDVTGFNDDSICLLCQFMRASYLSPDVCVFAEPTSISRTIVAPSCLKAQRHDNTLITLRAPPALV